MYITSFGDDKKEKETGLEADENESSSSSWEIEKIWLNQVLELFLIIIVNWLGFSAYCTKGHVYRI